MYVGRHRASLGRRLWELGGRRWVQIVGLAVLGLVVVSGLLLMGARVLRGGSIPHVNVAGTEVGGLSEPELRAAIVGLEQDYAAKTITFVRPAGADTPQVAVTAVAGDLGYQIDVDATVDAVLDRGRQGNPFAALSDQVFSTFGTVDVQPVHDIDQARFEAWLSRTTANLSTFAQEGTIMFDGATVTPVHPAAGVVVQRSDLQAQATSALEAMSTGTVYLPFTVERPITSADLVDAALGKANMAVSGSVTLTRGDGAVTFTAAEIGSALRTEPRRLEDGTIELAFVADAGRVSALAADEVDSVETDPEDATISWPGADQDRPREEGVPVQRREGRHPARGGGHVPVPAGRAAGRRGGSGLHGRGRQGLGDRRAGRPVHDVLHVLPASSDQHPPDRRRHRRDDREGGADLHDQQQGGGADGGQGLRRGPGHHQRRARRPAGRRDQPVRHHHVQRDLLRGYDFLEYKAHSYYFTRYPAGREATVYWPSPDLAFKNDSKAAIYIDTSYTATSITVTFYGHQDFQVEALSSGGSNFTDPETQCKANPDIAAGQSTVTQEGSQGFDITVTRRFHYPNGSTKDEKFFTHYKPEPRIVEQQSCTEPSPEPTPSESPSPSPSGAPATGSHRRTPPPVASPWAPPPSAWPPSRPGCWPPGFHGASSNLGIEMQSTLEETDRHTVRISVEIPFDEVARGLDRAYRRSEAEVTIPGFRRGKVPRQIIDARVGRDAVYHEFVEESVPEYYVQALREHELAPIGEPEIDIDGHAIVDGEPFRFSATVEVRPRLVLEPEQYQGVQVDAPSPEPTEHDVDDLCRPASGAFRRARGGRAAGAHRRLRAGRRPGLPCTTRRCPRPRGPGS